MQSRSVCCNNVRLINESEIYVYIFQIRCSTVNIDIINLIIYIIESNDL